MAQDRMSPQQARTAASLLLLLPLRLLMLLLLLAAYSLLQIHTPLLL